VSSEALTAIGEIVERGGDADDILRAVVDALVEHGPCTSAAIYFRDEGALVPGPRAGTPGTSPQTFTPVVYGGAEVAELRTAGSADDALLARIAELIAVQCLVGWDTGGVPWNPAA
jgi:hypothetical protein